jgi:hypothetical protein
MPATGLTSPPLRELARRISSGTDVTLLWNERTGALTVSVRNHGTGSHFQFTAPARRGPARLLPPLCLRCSTAAAPRGHALSSRA